VIDLLIEDAEIVDSIDGTSMSEFVDYLKSFSAPNNPWKWQHQSGAPDINVRTGSVDMNIREGWARHSKESEIPF
jgi:hypothetical protein